MDPLDRLNELGCWDYELFGFDGSRLVLAGSTDLSYYHLVEAEFEEVSFVSCPANFSHPRFRRATSAEESSVGRLVAIDAQDILVAIDAESSGSTLEPQTFFVLATKVSLREGKVTRGAKA